MTTQLNSTQLNSTQLNLRYLAGPILLHPPNQEVQDILSIVGTPVVCHSEGELSFSSSFSSSSFPLLPSSSSSPSISPSYPSSSSSSSSSSPTSSSSSPSSSPSSSLYIHQSHISSTISAHCIDGLTDHLLFSPSAEMKPLVSLTGHISSFFELMRLTQDWAVTNGEAIHSNHSFLLFGDAFVDN